MERELLHFSSLGLFSGPLFVTNLPGLQSNLALEVNRSDHQLNYILLAFFNWVSVQFGALRGWGPLKGALSAQKALQGVQDRHKLICMEEQKRWSFHILRWSLVCWQIRLIIFSTKRRLKWKMSQWPDLEVDLGFLNKFLGIAVNWHSVGVLSLVS